MLIIISSYSTTICALRKDVYIELGNKNPTIETLSYICDALEISLAEFFAEETENSLMEDETLRTFYRLSAYQRKALLLFLKTLQDE